MSTWIAQSLRAIVSDLSMYDGREVTAAAVDGFTWRIAAIYRELLAREVYGELYSYELEMLESVEGAYCCIIEAQKQLDCHYERSILCVQEGSATCRTGAVGRPFFYIPRSVLQHLLDTRLSVPKISQLLGVSVSTIRRRMADYDLRVRDTYSAILDDELDSVVASASLAYPTWGVRQMYGHLVSLGIRVQFVRVRESLSRVDPQGSFMRRLRHLRRRKYSVAGPQSLWHIDGNHKLIR